MKRTAFTMMELIFVIIVIGILAAVFIPRMTNNNLSRATNQLITDIRYTQHLALMDDKYDRNDNNWFKKRWSINLCQAGYKIASLDNSHTALAPQTKAQMDGSITNDYNLTKKYGVAINVTPANQCTIAFDHLGRPFGFSSGGTGSTPTANLLHNDVNITLTKDGVTHQIQIQPETGYVHLL